MPFSRHADTSTLLPAATAAVDATHGRGHSFRWPADLRVDKTHQASAKSPARRGQLAVKQGHSGG
jgi:hypothetical protein